MPVTLDDHRRASRRALIRGIGPDSGPSRSLKNAHHSGPPPLDDESAMNGSKVVVDLLKAIGISLLLVLGFALCDSALAAFIIKENRTFDN